MNPRTGELPCPACGDRPADVCNWCELEPAIFTRLGPAGVKRKALTPDGGAVGVDLVREYHIPPGYNGVDPANDANPDLYIDWS